jgi:hypothetical protein
MQMHIIYKNPTAILDFALPKSCHTIINSPSNSNDPNLFGQIMHSGKGIVRVCVCVN